MLGWSISFILLPPLSQGCEQLKELEGIALSVLTALLCALLLLQTISHIAGTPDAHYIVDS